MSKLIETRADFQTLAEIRLQESKSLLDAGKWDGAYYLAGYAVELALKVCVIKALMSTDAFPAKDYTKDCYTHNLDQLVRLAGLASVRKLAMDADTALEQNWQEVIRWTEVARYHRMTQVEAETMYRAVADDTHGVLEWLRTNF